MRIKLGQDLATGVLFILVGIAALLTINFFDKLPMGVPQRPGTGVLPTILSWALIVTGGVLGLRAMAAGDEPVTGWAWRPLVCVTLAVVAFGYFIDDLGLVATMIVSMTLCALGTHETRWREFAIFTVIMLAIGVGMFVWLLGMPIPVWPTKPPRLPFAFMR